MTSPRRYAALLSAILVLPLTLSACGGDGGVPDDAAAKIGSDTITKATVDHWLASSFRERAIGAGSRAVAPDPPTYTKCIAQMKTLETNGGAKTTERTRKARCQKEYLQLREETMQFLISSAWTEGEAADHGIKMSDADVKTDFDKQRVQGFPTDKAYAAFLKSSGHVQEDLLYRIKIQELNTRLQAKVVEGTDKVTSAQIANFYNKNKKTFATGETRDYRVVLSKTSAKAEQVKAMLADGGSWKAIAAKYSLDKGTNADGGLLRAVPKGQMVKSLDEATFSAKVGVVSGPVKTPAGYITFEVEKINPAGQQSLKQATPTIRQQLIDQQKQTKLDAFTKEYQKKWKDRTECQKGYAMQLCKNAPKVQPTAAAPNADGSASGGSTTNK